MKTKSFFNFLFNEFFLGGYLIALGMISIVFSAALMLGIEITWDSLMILYSLTFSSLLYNRYKEQRFDFISNPQRTRNLKKYFSNLYFFIFFSILISIIILIYFNKISALLFVIFLFILTILYTKNFKGLTKKIIGFKNLYFSSLIGLAIIFIALYYSYSFFNPSFLFVFVFIFFRTMVNTIFLDIKDKKSDQKNNLLTIPLVFNDKTTRLILKTITFIAAFWILSGYLLDILPKFSLMLILTVPYTFYYLKKAEKKENFYLVNYILADLEFVLWPILILFGKIIL